MPAVGALPDAVLVAREHQPVLHVVEQGKIALFVLALDLADLFKQEGDVVEPLFPRLLGEARVHIRPFVVLAGSRVGKVFLRRGDVAAVQQLEPDLGVLLLVVGRLLKQRRDLHEAVLFGLARVVGVLVARLRFARKSRLQVCFRLVPSILLPCCKDLPF